MTIELILTRLIMTTELFRSDAYLKECTARVVAVLPEGLVLDRTVFYPVGGGQPGDRGAIELASGRSISVQDTRKLDDGSGILHVTSPGQDLRGLSEAEVTARVDWNRRSVLMRVHSMLHVLCAVIPEEVTGGSVREDGSGRLDFNIPDSRLAKDSVAEAMNRIILADALVSHRWISDAELEANDDLVRTMSVRPPRGQGRVRLVEIAGADLQACGGTHVARTAEIGRVEVSKIQKKGRLNRRVTVKLVNP